MQGDFRQNENFINYSQEDDDQGLIELDQATKERMQILNTIT